ncbi:hypothetical protein OESDEN_21671 [Oesophagostomum dentatum]|uniref:Uncharacterized protein n=1 Tax=Oesophagostomum dentatum TaxID=61180 RepID=A0A0B1S4B0_OESDE|nr:hypothetical protein OESDEN_21671 [Oesophagostomum dentatum]
MFELRLFLLATTCLSLTEFINAGTPCNGSQFTQGEVDLLLKLVNDVREKVRSGQQSNGPNGTFLPAAKSMPDLVCSLLFLSAAIYTKLLFM